MTAMQEAKLTFHTENFCLKMVGIAATGFVEETKMTETKME